MPDFEKNAYEFTIGVYKSFLSQASRSDLNLIVVYLKARRHELANKILLGDKYELIPLFKAFNEVYNEFKQYVEQSERRGKK